MSLSELERFVADLTSAAALRKEAGKDQADKSHVPPIERAVAFAASKGYAFTAGEVEEHIKATAKAGAKPVTVLLFLCKPRKPPSQ